MSQCQPVKNPIRGEYRLFKPTPYRLHRARDEIRQNRAPIPTFVSAH
jgi:hypothetical protein